MMIINEYNKDKILGGKMKRGFNQKPYELKDKINKEINQNNSPLKPEKTEEQTTEQSQEIKSETNDGRGVFDTYNKINRLK